MPIEAEWSNGRIHSARLDNATCPCDNCPDITFDFVPPRGAEFPALYIVGEAPGAEEAKIGKPFVGKSGELLNIALGDAGILHSIRIFNSVACRPTDKYMANRTPTHAEIANCSQFVKRDIQYHVPDVLLIMGKSAATAFFPELEKAKMSDIREMELWWEPCNIPVQVAYHPAYIARTGGFSGAKWPMFMHDINLCVDYIRKNRGSV